MVVMKLAVVLSINIFLVLASPSFGANPEFKRFQQEYSSFVTSFDGDLSFNRFVKELDSMIKSSHITLAESFEQNLEYFKNNNLIMSTLGDKEYDLILSNLSKNEKIICGKTIDVFWKCLEDMKLASNDLIFPGMDEVFLISYLWQYKFFQTHSEVNYETFCRK